MSVLLKSPTGKRTAIARAFVDARLKGLALPSYPGDFPATIGDAYAVQDLAIQLSGMRVGGWKVGRINPPINGTNRLSGPISADMIRLGDSVAMPVIAGGFAAAEAEFLLRVGHAPTGLKRAYGFEEARTFIDAVHVGIEIASSPFPGINLHGPAVTIADLGNNNGLQIGPEISNWRKADLNSWPVQLAINGVEVGAATAATMLDGPFGALCFLLEQLAARGIALEAGQWISTGAVTGVHEVAIGDRVEAVFDDRLRASCTIKASRT